VAIAPHISHISRDRRRCRQSWIFHKNSAYKNGKNHYRIARSSDNDSPNIAQRRFRLSGAQLASKTVTCTLFNPTSGEHRIHFRAMKAKGITDDQRDK
jgi:hypothetical protein